MPELLLRCLKNVSEYDRNNDLYQAKAHFTFVTVSVL